MRERVGDIWRTIGLADAICITTNGIVKMDGTLVMGKGIAKEAADMFPGIDMNLGDKVRRFGNKPTIAAIRNGTRIVSFPTKNHWKDPSDITLITRSAEIIKELANGLKWQYIAVPKPGCGCGLLTWSMVKSALEPIFDNRFVIYSKRNDTSCQNQQELENDKELENDR